MILINLCVFPGVGSSLVAQTVKNPLQCGRPGFDPWIGKIPWRRAWQPIPVFFPRESPWTEEPGGLQPMGSQRVRHNWATLLSLSIFTLSWTYPCAGHSVLFVLFICLKKLNVMLWSSELWVIEIKCNSSWFQRLLFTSWAFQGVELSLRIRIEN